jgi:hypothetical protein
LHQLAQRHHHFAAVGQFDSDRVLAGNGRENVDAFRASGARWVVATTFPEWESNCDCEDGDWRALNLERPPFFWPAPQELINERCTEAGGGWSDKSLGLWLLCDLPSQQVAGDDLR